MAEIDPSKPSSDYDASSPYWKMASDIVAGVEAMRGATFGGKIGGAPVVYSATTSEAFARQNDLVPQSPYLPKLPNEPMDEYDRRRRQAALTNIYGDISNNLASRPFAKECQLKEDSPQDLKDLAENIDGLGNNLHVFAKDVFKTAIDKAITWILCEYTKVPVGITLDDERRMGARPYWVHLPCERLLAVYSKFLNGTEVIFHARIDETSTEVDGFEEKTVKRIRVITREPITVSPEDPKIVGFHGATWKLYEETVTKLRGNKEKRTWDVVDEGEYSIGIIPLVPVILGKRDGATWRVKAPLYDLAFMQVKLFQMESNLDWTKELTAFPMLTGDGIKGTDDNNNKLIVPVGPRSILFAPPGGSGNHGTWKYLEPAGSSLNFLQSEIDKYKTEMRDLGMQPLSASNLTVVTTANLSMKASSACQAWALSLQDALEQAWKITVMWKKQDVKPEVVVYKDFMVKVEGSDVSDIASAEKDGVISKKLRFEEMKRRGTLSESADWEKDQEELAAQADNDILSPEVHIDPVTGMPVAVKPEHGVLNPPPAPPPPSRSAAA